LPVTDSVPSIDTSMRDPDPAVFVAPKTHSHLQFRLDLGRRKGTINRVKTLLYKETEEPGRSLTRQTMKHAVNTDVEGSGAHPFVNIFTKGRGSLHESANPQSAPFECQPTTVKSVTQVSPVPASHSRNAARRRDFLKHIGLLTAAGTGALSATRALANSGTPANASTDPMGVLVDLCACVGCRLCEHACKKANDIDPGPLESYDDQSVFAIKRRPEPQALTVVNAFSGADDQPVYAKINCVHCNYSACVSACIVGALEKQPDGAVTYDAWKCIGCRYCMVACPMQLPAYEYDNVLTPQVRKCQFCHHRTSRGELPACVEACPRQAMTYGRRSELIKLAHEKIEKNPKRYFNHVYGEHEVGGTAWMYLSPVDFEQVGFLKLGTAAPPALTEAIQHGVFKHWIAPIGWYGFLATMMWITGRKGRGTRADFGELSRVEGRTDDHDDGLEELHASATAEPERPPLPDSSIDSQSNESLECSSTAVACLERPRPSLSSDSALIPHPSALEHHAAPVSRSLNTGGVWALLALVLTGVAFGLYRFIFGLAASTNLDQQHPWGLWIAMDVGSGIALAGGGFVTAALVHIFHREHYHAVARSALLTALLGYTFYVPGLLADIGRWYNIWHPTLPNMWQGNSVLFEVGICVMLYLNVQYAEMAPILCERFMHLESRPRLARLLRFTHHWLERIMPSLLIAGVALSTFHQSSLGNLMVIAPYKLHPLWWTPISPILFLVSAMMVGFPMVIFTILFASWALKRKPEMHVLSPLSLYVPVFLAIYLVLKVGDIIVRHQHLNLLTLMGGLWIAEMLIGVILPLVMIFIPAVRRNPKLLAAAMLAVILGVVMNRLNVFVIAYHPPYAVKSYFPSITEFAVSIGLVAALMLAYRVAVTYLPILEPAKERS
jgi:Ni/Fe-hydrogenase subunit HybB-like protein/Fe-S-cluster-containing dehydrogenase component